LTVACQTPPEPLYDSSHGIKTIKPLIMFRNKAGRVGNRGSKHPKLDQERNSVTNISIDGVKGTEPETNPQSGQGCKEEEDGKEEKGKSRNDTVEKGHKNQNSERNTKVYKTRQDSAEGKNESGEIDLGDDPLIFDDHIGRVLEGGGKIHPRKESTVIKNGVREPIGWHASKFSENEGEDNHCHKGLEDRPESADDSLFVADFDISPDEKIQEFAIFPEFSQIEVPPIRARSYINHIIRCSTCVLDHPQLYPLCGLLHL